MFLSRSFLWRFLLDISLSVGLRQLFISNESSGVADSGSVIPLPGRSRINSYFDEF